MPSRTEGNRPPPPPPPPPPLSFPPMDHISALPNDVITRIFYFLPFKDVVKTSFLSRRWRYTWRTTTPHLQFDGVRHGNHEPPYSGFPSIPSFVDKVLRQCASAPVTKFHITDFSEADGPKLDLCLRFAKEHHVEDLRLRLIARSDGFKYELPQLLYCLSRLVHLRVSACRFSLDGTPGICWDRLKFLSMEDVELSDDILERILGGSPVLESLDLVRCRGVKNIVIDSTSVKDLVLIGGGFSDLEKIWAPHLLSLCVSGMWDTPEGRSGISLDNISSLVEAKLDFVIMSGWPGYLKELLEKPREVPTITIGGWCLQIMSQLEMEGVSVSKCKNLILEAPVSQLNLPGIADMLRSSQCLEKLVIHLTNLPRSKFGRDEESEDRVNFDGEELLCLRNGNSGCLAEHLKSVEISRTGANRFVLDLLKFLLRDEVVQGKLIKEKLVIEVKVPTHFVPRKLLGAKKQRA